VRIRGEGEEDLGNRFQRKNSRGKKNSKEYQTNVCCGDTANPKNLKRGPEGRERNIKKKEEQQEL